MREELGEAKTSEEDVLVLLEELSQKRRDDKIKMRAAGIEVSDDEVSEEE